MPHIKRMGWLAAAVLLLSLSGCSGGSGGPGTPIFVPGNTFVGNYSGTYTSAVRNGDLQVEVRTGGVVSFSILAQGLPNPNGTPNYFTSTVTGQLDESTGAVTATGALALGGDVFYNVTFTGTLSRQNGAVSGSGVLQVEGAAPNGTWSVNQVQVT